MPSLPTFANPCEQKKSFPTYKPITENHHGLYYFILPPDTHIKLSTTKENYEKLVRTLRVHLVIYENIP